MTQTNQSRILAAAQWSLTFASWLEAACEAAHPPAMLDYRDGKFEFA